MLDLRLMTVGIERQMKTSSYRKAAPALVGMQYCCVDMTRLESTYKIVGERHGEAKDLLYFLGI